MSENVTITIEDEKIIEALTKLSEKAQNLRPALRRIREIMHGSIMKNFEQEGRPEKWKELAPFTKEQRKNLGYTNGQILQRSGRLKNSITAKSDDKTAVVGTNKLYAKLMHFGGTVSPKNKKSLYLPTGAKKKGLAKFILVKTVKIPARPFMVLTSEDKGLILRALREEILR